MYFFETQKKQYFFRKVNTENLRIYQLAMNKLMNNFNFQLIIIN